MPEYRIFWGETHNNTHQFQPLPTPFDDVLRHAASHLDFYAAAYYTPFASSFRPGGHPSETDQSRPLILEGWKPQDRLDREWAEVQDATARHNAPGRFVTFPGYEWQGDGSGGDHNVYAPTEGLPIFRVDKLADLYACLRGRGAIAIPHHVGYRPGVRGRDWSVYDETLSPFCEIFSIHGCSETDEEWIGLRQNSHMGPGIGGGTWQDALDRGYRLGCIASTDGWDALPGRHGRGLMACLAAELTREALWEAFLARRVYAVTGDRIQLDFRINDVQMGQDATIPGPRRVAVRVVGLDALDRIELLRNGRVIATHCHQGTWAQPTGRARYKLRIEAGWGPRPNEMPPMTRDWSGELRLAAGRIVGCQPCWISPQPARPDIAGQSATFAMQTSTLHAAERAQNAIVFELEAPPDATLCLRMNGLEERATLADLARRSREMWFREECIALLAAHGVPPGSPERQDPYHHYAYKVKLHPAIPEAAYATTWEHVDDTPLSAEANYRVRVEQRNAQRAWSSPIWVRPD